MLLPGARYRRTVRLARPSVGLVGLISVLVLAGCGAVETYRSVSGINKNDPDPETAPFTPNLATGPPAPTSATSTAERQKLTQTLIAERTETQSDVAVLPAGVVPSPR